MMVEKSNLRVLDGGAARPSHWSTLAAQPIGSASSLVPGEFTEAAGRLPIGCGARARALIGWPRVEHLKKEKKY